MRAAARWLLALAVGCGRIGYEHAPDGGLDARVADAGTDAAMTSLDGGTDAGSSDAGTDAALDACAGTCPIDTVATAGLVTCDPDMRLYCSVPAEVCYLMSTTTGPTVGTCAAPGLMPPLFLSRIDCDGPGDCPAGQQCCHSDYALCNYVCVPNGQCVVGGPTQCGGTSVGPPFVLCDPHAPTCPPPQTCQRIAMAPPTPNSPIDTFGCM